jgi:hypothetical protein
MTSPPSERCLAACLNDNVWQVAVALRLREVSALLSTAGRAQLRGLQPQAPPMQLNTAKTAQGFKVQA